MMISGTSGTKPAGGLQKDSSSDIRSIEQKIQQLKNQLKEVKGNKNLTSEEREKKIEKLKEQIERLEEQKQKLEQKKGKDQSLPEESGEQGDSGTSPDPLLGNYIDTAV